MGRNRRFPAIGALLQNDNFQKKRLKIENPKAPSTITLIFDKNKQV